MEFRLGHRPELDGLRGLAVLAVMLGHCSIIGAKADLSAQGLELPIPSLGLREGLLHGGVFGVDIFYVLSGFLITSILLQEYTETGRVRLGAFYARRALRLLPAIFILLAACTFYVAFSGDSKGNFGYRPVMLALAYLANYARGFSVSMGMLTHTWSLSLEEQFYLIWPLTLLFLLRFPKRIVFGLVIFGAFFSAALRFALYDYGLPYLAWGSLPARADGLLFGIAVALMARWGWLTNRKLRPYFQLITWAAAIGLLCLLLFVHGGSPENLFRGWYFLASFTTAVLIAGLINRPPDCVSKALSWRPLTYTGKISYGLYLFHMPIYCLFPWPDVKSLGSPIAQLVCVMGVFTLSFFTASISYHVVEKKILSYKTRFTYRTAVTAIHECDPPDAQQLAELNTRPLA